MANCRYGRRDLEKDRIVARHDRFGKKIEKIKSEFDQKQKSAIIRYFICPKCGGNEFCDSYKQIITAKGIIRNLFSGHKCANSDCGVEFDLPEEYTVRRDELAKVLAKIDLQCDIAISNLKKKLRIKK